MVFSNRPDAVEDKCIYRQMDDSNGIVPNIVSYSVFLNPGSYLANSDGAHSPNMGSIIIVSTKP